MVTPNPAPETPQRGLLASGGMLAPLSFPAFRAIWLANLFSSIGSMIQSVGAAWLMTELTDSHMLIAMVQASVTLPIMLFGVIAGAIADNFDRRRVMLFSQFGMLIASAILALVTARDLVNPLSLLALTLLVGTGTAVNAPAWQASVRAQVGPKDLPQAISLNSIAFNVARSAGPALGGLLISIWDISLAFALNALSYSFLIIVLLRWKPGVARPERGPMFTSVVEGLRFCADSGPVRRVLTRGFAVGIGFAAYAALLPIIVRGQIGGSEIDFGLLLGAFGVASIVSALFVSQLRRRWGSEAVVTAGSLAFVLAEVAIANSTSMALAVPAAIVGGAGWVSTLTTLNVAMQFRSPDAILGRCLSIYQAVTFGAMAAGAWAWGAVAEFFEVQAALYGAAGFTALSLVALRILAPMPGRGEGVHFSTKGDQRG